MFRLPSLVSFWPEPPRGSAAADAPRALLLNGLHVSWRLRRSQRRSIGLCIDEQGLAVTAPRWTPLAEIEAALQSKANWITRQLALAQERRQRQQTALIAWGEGAQLPWLGRTLTLQRHPRPDTRPRAQAALWEPDSEPDSEPDWKPDLAPDGAQTLTLYLPLPAAASAAQWREAARTWALRQARRHFTARLDAFAPLMGVRWQKLALSSARTRWGSASANGSIRLNWRLMHFRPPVVDYVVVHELAHLHEMNHSPRFWAHVQAQLPGYAALRAELRSQTPPVWQ